MLGPRYIEANIDQAYYRQKCYQIHQEKLRHIEEKSRAQSKLSKKQDQLRQKVRESRMRNHVFQYNEKNAHINRENEVLMGKLIEISKGKWSSVQGRKSSTFGFRPNSLNVTSRKLESERITSQNHALARRILEKPASINKGILERDYYNSLKYQLLIRKSHKARMPHFQGRPGQLPPLELGAVNTSRGAIGQRSQSKPQNTSSIQGDPLQMSAPLLDGSSEGAIKVTEEEVPPPPPGETEDVEKTAAEGQKSLRGKKKPAASSSPNEKKKVGAYYSMDPFKSPKNASKGTALNKQQSMSQDIQDIKDDLEKKEGKKEEQAKKEPEIKEQPSSEKEKPAAKKAEEHLTGEKKIAEIYKSQSKKSLKKQASQKKVEPEKESKPAEEAEKKQEESTKEEKPEEGKEKKDEEESYEKDVFDEEQGSKKETTNIMTALEGEEGPKPSADVVSPGDEDGSEAKN